MFPLLATHFFQLTAFCPGLAAPMKCLPVESRMPSWCFITTDIWWSSFYLILCSIWQSQPQWPGWNPLSLSFVTSPSPLSLPSFPGSLTAPSTPPPRFLNALAPFALSKLWMSLIRIRSEWCQSKINYRDLQRVTNILVCHPRASQPLNYHYYHY